MVFSRSRTRQIWRNKGTAGPLTRSHRHPRLPSLGLEAHLETAFSIVEKNRIVAGIKIDPLAVARPVRSAIIDAGKSGKHMGKVPTTPESSVFPFAVVSLEISLSSTRDSLHLSAIMEQVEEEEGGELQCEG
jgi:hypothetical protein